MRCLALLFGLLGCAGDGSADPDGEADADADADSDADTDSDADADTDSDTDSDTDADSDADTDAEPEPDIYSGPVEIVLIGPGVSETCSGTATLTVLDGIVVDSAPNAACTWSPREYPLPDLAGQVSGGLEGGSYDLSSSFAGKWVGELEGGVLSGEFVGTYALKDGIGDYSGLFTLSVEP